jgi:hypothetical protein
VIVEDIHQRGGLRAGLTVTVATDILWALNHPDMWLLLHFERGWTPDRFEMWFADITCDQLLATPKPRRATKAR